MNDTRRKFESFTFYDKTGIEAHLQAMAEEGWLLEKISAFRWTYRRIEPKKIHFSVSYYATISDFEPEPTEEQQSFNDFCEYSGWKLAASTVQMQVFYNENENPVPIETDPMLEIQNIHRSVKKTVLVSLLLLLFLGFLMGSSFISTLLGDPIYLFSSATKMLTGVWWIVACVYSLTELISYFLWRHKAKKVAEQGIFLETRGHRNLSITVLIFMLASLVLYLISLGNSGMQFFMTAFLLIVLAGFAVVNGVKTLLKKKKVKAGTNKIITIVASFALAFVLVSTVNFITIYGLRNGIFENDFKDLPFTVGDLLEIDDRHYIKTRGKEDSILFGQFSSSQHIRDNSDSPTMSYTITEVKLPFLYDFCVEQLYHQYDSWRGYDSEYEYIKIDADIWGAKHAWELYKDGQPDNKFLICYDKHILEISVDWELTYEQMKVISENVQH